MGQIKGRTGNPFGRPRGKPNRITADLREFLKQLMYDNLDQFREDFRQLDPKDRLIIMEKFLSFILPKLSNVTVFEDEDPQKLKTREDFLNRMRKVDKKSN